MSAREPAPTRPALQPRDLPTVVAGADGNTDVLASDSARRTGDLRQCGVRGAVVVLLLLGLAPGGSAQAAPIVAGQFTVPVVLTQSVELFPGTPFNPGRTSFTVIAGATGSLTVNHELQVGNTIVTVPSVRLAGVFPSPLPPIPYEILAGTPDLPASRGLISNVVQDPGDPGFPTGDRSSLLSGNFREEAFFKLVLADGTTVYSDPNQAAIFTALLSGLPYPAGTVFDSSERLNLYLQIGPGFDPARDPVIGQSFDRRLTVVPEPSTVLILAGMATVAGGLWRRRRHSPASVPAGVA